GEFRAFVGETKHSADGGCYAWNGSEWKQALDMSWRSPGFTQDDHHPVVCINWNDAKAFAAWLSKKIGHTYHLLSEAEWEYATRAGTSTSFWWGRSISTAQANYEGRRGTVRVDSFQPNPWGLYNVHGNVWDWTEDCLHRNYQGAPADGSAWTSGDCSYRMVRGGSWFSSPQKLRSAYHFWSPTDFRDITQGFRVARTLNP